MMSMLDVKDHNLGGVKELIPRRFGDDRGFFSETYNAPRFKDAGIDINWIQDNHSYSADKFVLRGLHFQTAPYEQTKLVRVITGTIYDVAVDLREGSPTYLKSVGVTLSAEKGNQLLVPAGFAHGFLTLTPGVHVIYKVDNVYSPDNDCSVKWDDPEIAIDWPLDGATPILSDKDRQAPLLRDSNPGFRY